MSKKFRNLYHQIYDWDNLLFAYKEARRGKTNSSSFLKFKEHHLANLRQLQRSLIDETWETDGQLTFTIQDPKVRTISCQSFRDRVLHHALIQVIGPILDDAMMPQVFACRVGKGTHKCLIRTQQLMRQNPNNWILHVDFSKFFPTIPQDLLIEHIKKKISCKKTLQLIKKILIIQCEGLPIGSLTSQIFSNYWGGKLDRFIAERNGGNFVRYMDDTVIITNSKETGIYLKNQICNFVKYEMKQKIGKWYLKQVKNGITFCGFRIRIKYKLIKRQSMIRQRKKLKLCLQKEDYDAWKRSQLAWIGHMQFADKYNGLKHLNLAI
jgi:retron-type reverse transcriptase